MQDLSTVLTSLTIAAGLALGVERTLEVLKHIMASETGFLRRSEYKDAVDRTKDAINKAKTGIGNDISDTAAPLPDERTGPTYPTPAADIPPVQKIYTDLSPMAVDNLTITP
jgi:hypothetical protein